MATARQSWQFNESGILRKKEGDEELLVFGYSCKLFRDDEKALFIDQGKHLIPWMGDDTLRIDRYDGRGALYDLKQYEPLPGGHDANRWVGLSEAERRVEQLCDEERYRALHHNEEEEALYQEEELKRLHQALGSDYGQVAFNYEESSGKTDEQGEAEAAEEDEEGDEPYVAPPELDIPVNMVLPETVKLNAIILKTAMFINQQGAQMEILLKMKQANNPQFLFLSFDSPLHPYYRHLLMAIKTGRYRPPSSSQPQEESHEDVGEDHYLHPSLAPTGSRLELAPSIPSINYKPSADCAYSMLVNRIKDKQVAFGLRPPDPIEVEEQPLMYYPEPLLIPEPSPVIAAAPVRYEPKPVVDEVVEQPLPEVVKPPKIKTKNKAPKTPVAAAAAMLPVAMPVTALPALVSQPVVMGPVQEEVVQKMYSDSSASSSRSSSPPLEFVMPPADMQIIIDKMASYVAKNGQDFEAIVKSKGDPRFAFLEMEHQFHAYYRHKIAVYTKLEAKEKSKPEGVEMGGEESQDVADSQRSDEDGEDSRDGSRSSRSKPAPVCFSIKKPKEAENTLLEKRSALPIEESTDEEEGQEGDKEEKKEKEKEKKEKEKEKKEKEKEKEKKRKKSMSPEIQAAPLNKTMEVIDLTEEISHSAEEEKKAKWAEERLKDKLVAAAREKMAAAAREKQLQMERKRRAAAFLNMIQKEHPMQAPPPPIIGPLLPDGCPVQRIFADEDDEVSSIPSPSSSDITSPVHIVRHHSEDRLSPKQQNGDTRHSSQYNRVHASSDRVKRRADQHSPGSDGSADSKSKTNGKHRHKHKRKKSSSRKRDRSPSLGSHSRPHRPKVDHRSKKPKRRHESRSRSRSHSKLPFGSRSSSHPSSSHAGSSHEVRKERRHKKKKSSRQKSGHSSESG